MQIAQLCGGLADGAPWQLGGELVVGKGQTIVGFVPGVWDMFHVGHLNLLLRARAQCDVLIAGVLSDEAVLSGKGQPPVIPFEERLQIVSSLRIVDRAVRDASLDKLAMWEQLRFNVLFKGDDWRGTPKGDRMERGAAERGVRVVYFPYTEHISSTRLREDISEYVSRGGE